MGKGVQNLATNVGHDRLESYGNRVVNVRRLRDEGWSTGMSIKWTGLAMLAAALTAAVPAKAEELRADDARRFIAGKHFRLQLL